MNHGFCSALLLVVSGLPGCSAVYPEVATPVRAAPSGTALRPPPPADLYFLRFQSATIPAKTRDGRNWDAIGGSAPDPFAKVFVDDKELFRTPVQSNTLEPTWPDAKKENYRVGKSSIVKVELWDANPVNDHPICVRILRDFQADARSGLIDIDCDSGAKMRLVTEPAHAKVGLGMYYEFRTDSVYVTRVAVESPASRIGVKPGDEIVRIQGKEVKGMDEPEARSLINANAPTGVTITLRHSDGGVVDTALKDGPIYPTVDDDIPVD
jgi:membrane-associated protease RseP (regulator of RpoE activity)